MMPALSADVQVRDAFFASLSQEQNREKEAWVASALSYLHHPLRSHTSEKYLKQSLDLLEEIQLTGDIFFPTTGPHYLRSNQLMLEWYYQMKLVNGCFFQTALTEIPTPGQSASIPGALALSLRLIALF